MNDGFAKRLSERLKRPLPGRAAHVRFAPDMSFGRQSGPAPDTSRRAAVMMLLYRHDGEWFLPLTLRCSHLTEHAGQISFPGGLIERGESSGQAARRELREELGIDGVELVGRLSNFYVFISNIRVTPWIGWIDGRPSWQPNPAEVDQVLEVPLRHLLEPTNTGVFQVDRFGSCLSAPCFLWQEHRIWGATSMMLGELVQILAEVWSDGAE